MKIISGILLAFALSSQALEIKTFSNGQSCIVNRDLNTLDCSAPSFRGPDDDTFIEMESGHIMNRMDRDTIIDMETGERLLDASPPSVRDDDLELR
jgi:hypothetical protein